MPGQNINLFCIWLINLKTPFRMALPVLLTKTFPTIDTKSTFGETSNMRACEDACGSGRRSRSGRHYPRPSASLFISAQMSRCILRLFRSIRGEKVFTEKKWKGRRLCRCFLWKAYRLAEAHGKLPKRALNLDSFSFYDYPSKNKWVERLSVSQAAQADILDHKWNPLLSFSHTHTSCHIGYLTPTCYRAGKPQSQWT